MTIRTWTVKGVPVFDYERVQRITELWAGRAELSLKEILLLPMPARERMWFAWQTLNKEAQVELATRIIAWAVREYALPRYIAGAWAEAWLDGSDRSGEAAAKVRVVMEEELAKVEDEAETATVHRAWDNVTSAMRARRDLQAVILTAQAAESSAAGLYTRGCDFVAEAIGHARGTPKGLPGGLSDAVAYERQVAEAVAMLFEKREDQK